MMSIDDFARYSKVLHGLCLNRRVRHAAQLAHVMGLVKAAGLAGRLGVVVNSTEDVIIPMTGSTWSS
jgi:hypothetical protein